MSGVTVGDGCTFTMNGGTIKEHQVDGGGAGVHVVQGTFIMNAGTISKNFDSAGNGGGGVDVYNGTFIMNGGTISQNTSRGQGGGVCITKTTENISTFTISGNAVIKDNTAVDGSSNHTTNNVYLNNDQLITIGQDGLTTGADGAKIGVTTRTTPDNDRPVVAITGSNSTDYSSCFISDNNSYEIKNGNNNVVQLTAIHTHNWTYSATDNIITAHCDGGVDCEYNGNGGTLTITAPTDLTYNSNEKPAALTVTNDWQGTTVTQSDIKYAQKSGSDWTDMTGVPTEVGEYQARITVGGVTASVTYEITAASSGEPSIITHPTAKPGLVYNGSEQTLINAGVAAAGKTLEYSLDGASYSETLPAATNAGKYAISYKVQGESDVHSIQVFITSASLTGTPTFSKITESGKKLKDVTVTLPEAWPNGTFMWTRGEVGWSSETEVTQGTAYKWAFIPDEANSKNYLSTGGTLIPWEASSNSGSSSGGSSSSGSGGGSSSKPSYSVSTPSNVSTDKKSASKGDAVKLTVEPDEGYVVAKVLITDAKGNPVKVIANDDGTFSFVQPDSKVDIQVVYTPETSPFEDVTRNDYFYDAVKWAKAQNVTGGVGGGLFGPANECTRAQIVTFLWRTSGSPQPKGDSGFSDVPSDSYYAKAVAWAVEHGITQGTSKDQFSPDATCTRAQGITFLWRMAGSPAVTGSASFLDVADNDYFAPAVIWAQTQNITGGVGSNLFGSADQCTRAQIVTFLYRAFGK